MSNTNLDAAQERELTDIKKYQRQAGQVKMKLDWLHDWIPALAIFVRYSRRMYNNKEVTKNMKVKQNIDWEQMSSFFVQLYGFIQYWKLDGKDISDTAKLVKERMRCSIVLGISRQLC